MAKNFYGLKDSYQATYILENVIQNFTDFPDVVADAQNRTERIKGRIKTHPLQSKNQGLKVGKTNRIENIFLKLSKPKNKRMNLPFLHR
jgi:hypothetical protein